MNRFFHLAGLAWCLVAGSVLFFERLRFVLVVGYLLAGFTIFLVAKGMKRKLPLWVQALAAVFCICPLYVFLYLSVVQLPLDAAQNQTVHFTGLVERVEAFGSEGKMLVRVKSAEVAALNGKCIRIYAGPALDVVAGDVVEYELRLSRDPLRAFSLLAEGVAFEALDYTPPVRVGTDTHSLFYWTDQARQFLASKIRRVLSFEEGDLLAAMLLGDNDQISYSWRSVYSRSGIAHILSVSGMHLAIFSGLIERFLLALSIPKRRRCLLNIVSIAFFVVFAGLTPSVIRAGIMMLLCQLGLLLGRDSDSLNALGMAVILMQVWNPYILYSIGLQLSYTAVMGIALYAQPLANWSAQLICRQTIWELLEQGGWRYQVGQMFSAMGVSLAASLMTAPIVCWYFGELSVWTVPVNLLIGPIVGPIFACGMFCMFLGCIGPLHVLSMFFGLLAGLLLRLVNEIAVFFAGLPLAAIPVQSNDLFIWMVGTAVALLILGRRAVWRDRAFCLQIAVCVLLVNELLKSVFWGNNLEIFVPKGGGATALVYGTQAVTLGVPKNQEDAQRLKTFLKARGVHELSLAIWTEPTEKLSSAGTKLTDTFSPQAELTLDAPYDYEVELFGDTLLSYSSEQPGRLEMEAGGLLIVWETKMHAVDADLLINPRGQLVVAPWVKLSVSQRYYNAHTFQLCVQKETENA